MKRILVFLFIITILITPHAAFAIGSAGFENASFSAASIAESEAVVAQADEAAAISYNPAGLSYLPGVQVQGNIGLLSSITRRSRNGGIDYSAGTIHAIPTGYITINPGRFLNNRVAFGIGSDSPFGLANKYDSNLPQVRYTGWNNYLKMYTIKPVASIKVADWLSIGGGPVYYRITDYGTIAAYPNSAVFGAGTPDGQIRLNNSGNAWGWQMGVLAKPHVKHQFGFYFRSPVTVFTRGLTKVEGSTQTGTFEGGNKSKLDLPLNFTWGYAFKPTVRDTIEFDLGYTRWGAFKRTYFDSTQAISAADDAILNAIGKIDRDFSDSWSIHLGGKHKFKNEKVTLRGGSFFYWHAVPERNWTPAIPDGNRLGFTFGPSFHLTKNLDFDASYMAQLVLRRTIDNSLSESIGGSVDGKYFSYIQGLYLTMTYKWEDLFNADQKKIEKKNKNNK